jgi:integrase
VGVYDRGKGRKRNLWISYTVTNELRARHGLRSMTVREPVGTPDKPVGDKRVAESFLAERKREVKAGTWTPRKLGGGKDGLTLAAYAATWHAEREADGVTLAGNERQWLADYVLPELGHMRLDRILRDDIKRVMASVGRSHSKRFPGRKLSPRTVGHVYRALSRLFKSALQAGLITVSPCTLEARTGELPTSKDASPGWRAGAIFTRDELVTLISDERIPQYRRVLYALCGLAGLRIGEAVGRRWRDYDAKAEPLGRLDVSTQLDGAELKTEIPRAVPVHPVLARILAEWKLGGYALQYGDDARPDDFIVRSRNGMIRPITAWTLLQDDLRRLGMRKRRIHDLRRSHITLSRTDGATELLRFVTHGASGSILDLYTSPPWPALCAEVAKLKIEIHSGSVVDIRKKPRAV